MKYILYASSAVRPFTGEQLEDLLALSRRNNAAAGISGMLLYHDGNFIQYIEGDGERLDSLFSRIGADRRHHQIMVMDRGSLDKPVMAGWSMGYERLSDAAVRELPSFDLSRQTLESALDPELPKSVLKMMRTFYNTAFQRSPR